MGERLRAVAIGWLTLVGAAIALLAATAAVGWMLPAQRTFARSIVLAQPTAAVWSVVADVRHEGDWNPGIVSIMRVNGLPWTVADDAGVREVEDRVVAAGAVVERVRAEPNGGDAERWTIRCDPAGSGTRVTLTCRTENRWPFARCWALLGGDERRIERALAGLAKRFGQSAAIDTVPPDDEESHAEPPQAVPVR